MKVMEESIKTKDQLSIVRADADLDHQQRKEVGAQIDRTEEEKLLPKEVIEGLNRAKEDADHGRLESEVQDKLDRTVSSEKLVLEGETKEDKAKEWQLHDETPGVEQVCKKDMHNLLSQRHHIYQLCFCTRYVLQLSFSAFTILVLRQSI